MFTYQKVRAVLKEPQPLWLVPLGYYKWKKWKSYVTNYTLRLEEGHPEYYNNNPYFRLVTYKGRFSVWKLKIKNILPTVASVAILQGGPL